MSTNHGINRSLPLVDRFNDAVRENPLAAGLIGAGLAWMLFGTKGFGIAAGVAKDMTGRATSAAVSAGSYAADGVRKAASGAADVANDVASTVADQAASLVPDINASGVDKPADNFKQAGTAVFEGAQSAIASGREYGAVIQSRLSESLERQPLLLGAIGLALGVGIASTFATTEVESQWLGEAGEATRNVVKDVVDEVKTRAGDVVSEVQDEATRQGLTLDAAQKAVSTVSGKVKNVAASAQEAVKKPFT